ncbi:MAG: beta-galactosidase [Bacteroidales bacterium]
MNNISAKSQTCKAILFLLLLLPGAHLFSQSYEIDVANVKQNIKKGHLDLGGKSSTGESIEVNSFYIERNGSPYIPVIGEFHYSRFPNQYWDTEIRKIKAGGVKIVATYVFWNLHERKEGHFNWTGDLNLRRFVEHCKANCLDVIVRIGPFAHGEMRNGGLPDWLYGRPFEVRSNDPAYLSYVEKLYKQIGNQLQSLYFKDGGPIIAIQLENEYQHSAAPWGVTYEGADKEVTSARFDKEIIKDGVGVNQAGNDYAEYGQKHMQTLKKLAIEAGMEVPLYTATGWGFASIINNGSLPVMAGYAYPFWEAGNKPSPFYLFKDIHKNPDYSPVSYKPEDYPSIAAELGTGMCVTYSRRPKVLGESFLPLMVRTLGSGSNGLGYYMYHGGNTPSDNFMFFSEGSGLNLKSYDYQAPIGEWGNVEKGFYGLKVINSFINNYGHLLAPLVTVLPETNSSIEPADTSKLRYAVRSDGTRGFVFLHNFQDHIKTIPLKGLKINVTTKENSISFPQQGSFDLHPGTSAIFPFNQNFGELTLESATVQPLCSFNNKGTQYHVFISFNGIIPEFVWKGNQKVNAKGLKVSVQNNRTFCYGTTGRCFEFEVQGSHFLVIPFEKALNAYVVDKKAAQKLVMSEAVMIEKDNRFEFILTGKDNLDIDIYPAGSSLSSSNAVVKEVKSKDKLFSSFNISINKIVPEIYLAQTDDRHFVLDASRFDFTKLEDVYIKFDYRGDRAVCMLNGELVADNLYTSQPWKISLKRYSEILKNKEMYFYFLPMKNNAPYLSYLEKEVVPDFTAKNDFLLINSPEIIPEYKVIAELK